MDEKNITLQALEDGENKGESRSSNVENFSVVEGGLDQSDEAAALVQESHITSMNTAEEVVHSQVTDVAHQEQEPCSQVTETAQDAEPSKVTEAAQKLEKEDNGMLGFDLNQEGLPEASVLFDLNTASPGLQESPREGKLGLNFDLNHYSPSPSASPLQSSSSSLSSSLPPPSVESFDKNDTEKPRVHDESLLRASEPVATVRIMGKNVETKPNDVIYLFGVELGRRSVSPSSVVDPPPVSVCSSTSGKKRKGPESGLEPIIDAKKKANSSCSTVGKKRKGTESGLEPNMDAKKKAVDKEGREREGNNILGMAERGGACTPSAVVESPLVSLSCANSSGGMKRKEPESGSDAYVAKKKKSCPC